MPDFRRKQMRLKSFPYKGSSDVYFVTIRTHGGIKYFDRCGLANVIQNEFDFRIKQGGIVLYCYCIMPDHIHFFLSFRPDYERTLSAWIKDFKRFTAKMCKDKFGVKQLWQENYYDHIVRSDESLVDIGEYIIQNPVRKGTVNVWEEYPYSKICYESIEKV